MIYQKVTTRLLKRIKPGESAIFVERSKKKAPGAEVTAYACRAKVKVTTSLCLVVYPKTMEAIRAITVTRIPNA